MSFFKAVKKNSNEGRGWSLQGLFCTFKMLFHNKVLGKKFRQSLAQSLNFSVYEKFCLIVIAKCRRLVFLSSSFWLVNQWGVSFWHGSTVVKSTKIGIEIYATKFSIVVEGISFIRSTCWTCSTGRWWCGRRRSYEGVWKCCGGKIGGSFKTSKTQTKTRRRARVPRRRMTIKNFLTQKSVDSSNRQLVAHQPFARLLLESSSRF